MISRMGLALQIGKQANRAKAGNDEIRTVKMW